MKCEQSREFLEDLIAGKLSGQEARSVRAHIASCSACSAGLTPSQLVEILPAFDETIEPSGDFAARFRARLKSRAQPWWKRIAGWGWPLRLAAAGALAAIIFAGIFVGLHPEMGQERAASLNEFGVAENLPLLEDMPVISNLDLLEDFDTIENLPDLMKETNGTGRQ